MNDPEEAKPNWYERASLAKRSLVWLLPAGLLNIYLMSLDEHSNHDLASRVLVGMVMPYLYLIPAVLLAIVAHVVTGSSEDLKAKGSESFGSPLCDNPEPINGAFLVSALPVVYVFVFFRIWQVGPEITEREMWMDEARKTLLYEEETFTFEELKSRMRELQLDRVEDQIQHDKDTYLDLR